MTLTNNRDVFIWASYKDLRLCTTYILTFVVEETTIYTGAAKH